MDWSMIHQITLGVSFGTFAFLYVLVLFKGIPEALKSMKSDEKKES